MLATKVSAAKILKASFVMDHLLLSVLLSVSEIDLPSPPLSAAAESRGGGISSFDQCRR
jgi:hypothetical protein